MKNIPDGSSVEFLGLQKIFLFFLFLQLYSSLGPNLPKKLCWKLHEMPITPWKFNFGNLHPIGKGIGPCHQKQHFDGSCMKCTELHETHVSPITDITTQGWRVGDQCTNNAM